MEVRSVVRWISYTLHELYNEEEGRKLNDSGGGLMGSLETNDALPLLRRTLLLLLRDERNIQWMLFGEYYSVNIIQWALFTESQWAESQWIPSLFASFVQRKIVQYHYVLAVSANIRRSSWTSQPHVYWVSDSVFQTPSFRHALKPHTLAAELLLLIVPTEIGYWSLTSNVICRHIAGIAWSLAYCLPKFSIKIGLKIGIGIEITILSRGSRGFNAKISSEPPSGIRPNKFSGFVTPDSSTNSSRNFPNKFGEGSSSFYNLKTSSWISPSRLEAN